MRYYWIKGGIIASGEIGNLKHLKSLMKRGYKMSFKDAKRAKDEAEVQAVQLDKVEGIDLLLKSYELMDTYSMGQKATLHCENEDSEEVTLFTFSAIVIDQLKAIETKLPLIITPEKHGIYYTIY